MANFVIHDCKYDFGNLFTGEPLLMGRNPIYIAGQQPPTATTGGDEVVVLENRAYSLPRDLQVAPGTQPVAATTGGGDSQHKE